MHAFRPWARAASFLATGLLGFGLASAQAPATAPVAPTAASAPAALSAEERRYIEGLIDDWPGMVISLPAQLPLDADMAARAKTLTAEMELLMKAAGRRWLQEIRAAHPQASAPVTLLHLMARMNDELVAWLVSSPGAEREATEWRLAQHPGYCRLRSKLHEDGWALLADRLLFLMPLQGSERDAAIAAERQRWQRWLSGSLPATSSPMPSPQLQAFQAAERQRADEPVGTRAMTPWLSRQVLGERPPVPYGGLMVECALMQWWLANEVPRAGLSPEAAMRLFRFGTLPANENLLLMAGEVRQRARRAAAEDYPPIAQRFEVTGATEVAVVIDAAGRVRDVQIIRRTLQMPGLRPGHVPLALEQTMDRATFARVRAMRHAKPDASKLRQGVVSRQLELLWNLD
ncbi:energy transducer TonB [Rubrivivax rivuli]|uniref:TonB C-terminal domain-containing protein n=1 Tax=Rubrivivax rivuli TaxID=1862385 RepID=A0A437RRX6_9BURK|nr:hypothetical protein [Rubrivivax rivuli]RVU49547.1 hypothetical protein EOE66_02985 [Rubrivivax rivuli]